jgi:hypothetical protein
MGLRFEAAFTLEPFEIFIFLVSIAIIISACPPVCPLLHSTRAHSIPYLAIQYHTRHGAAPLHTGTIMRALAAGATRLQCRYYNAYYHRAIL